MHACPNKHIHALTHSYVDSYEKSTSALKSNLTAAQQKECFPRIILSWDCRGSGEWASVFVCLYFVCVCVCLCARDQAEQGGFYSGFH